MCEFSKPNTELTQMAHAIMPFAKCLGLEFFEIRKVARSWIHDFFT